MSLVGSGSSNEGFAFVFPAEASNPCSVIVEAVAWFTDCAVIELSPLADTVDPDALNALIREMNQNTSCRSPNDLPSESAITRIEFEYEGTRIVVEPDGFTITNTNHQEHAP